MPRQLWKHLWVIVLVAAGAAPIIAASSSAARLTGPWTPAGTVAGVVVDARSGIPIPGAVVSVSLQGRTVRGLQVVTDSAGRFVLEELAAGEVSLLAVKNGYSGGGYGQNAPFGRPQSFVLGDGERVTVTLRLWKHAVVTGQVRDSAGQGITGVTVLALRETALAGVRRFIRTRNASTDDRGVYRISGLGPGRYLVVVPAARPRRGSDAKGYCTTFYPGSLSAAGSEVLALQAGDERAAVDFVLTPVSSLSVSGTISGLDAAVRLLMRLVPADDDAVDLEAVTAIAAGSQFRFDNVPPGRYSLRAVEMPSTALAGAAQTNGAWMLPMSGPLPAVPSAPTLWADVPVTVDRNDITGLAVQLQSGARIRGRLVFDGTSERPTGSALLRLAVTVETADNRDLGSVPLARIEEDGTFCTIGLPAGEYVLSALLREAPKWSVGSVEVPSVNSRGDVVKLGAHDVSGVVVKLTDRPAELSGIVRDRKGEPRRDATVYVFPTERDLWTGHGRSPNRFFQTPCAADGMYAVKAIAPGSYYVTAEIAGGRDMWRLPEELDSLVAGATMIKIAPGQKHVRDVPVRGTN